MSAFINDYGITKVDGTYKVMFQIPENCHYVVSLDYDYNNVITINLKPDQKIPSTKFDDHVEFFPPINDEVNVEFEVPADIVGDGQVFIKKPKLKVQDLNA